MRTKADLRRYHQEYMRRYRLSPAVREKEAEHAKRYYQNPTNLQRVKDRQKTERYRRHVAEYRQRPEIAERTAIYEKSEHRRQLNRLTKGMPGNVAKARLRNKEWRKKNWDTFLKDQRERYGGDLSYKVKMRLRVRLSKVVTRDNKSATTMALLGCPVAHFLGHLESKFSAGMSWANYGRNGWHIDHVIPCSFFDLKDSEQQRICFNFRNLQPLWERENELKHNRLPDGWQGLLEKIRAELDMVAATA